MQDLPTSYVQASRAKQRTRFYTTKDIMDEYLQFVEDSPLAKQMAKAPDLRLASDLLQEAVDSHKRGMAQTDWTRRATQSTTLSEQSHQAQLAEMAPELAAIFGDSATVAQVAQRQLESSLSSSAQVQAGTAGDLQHVLNCLLQPQEDIILSQEVLPPLDQVLASDALSTDVPLHPELTPLLAASADPQPLSQHSLPSRQQEFIETLHPEIDNSLMVPSYDTATSYNYTSSESINYGQADYAQSLADQSQQFYQQQYAAAAQTWTTQQIAAATGYRLIQH